MKFVPARTVAVAVACMATLSCGATHESPASPENGNFYGAAAVTTLMTEIVDTVQREFFRRDQIDWTSVRAQVMARASGGVQMRDAYPAVQLVFQLLNDPHGGYTSATGLRISSSTSNNSCLSPATTTPTLPAEIGYIQVTSTSDNTGAYSGAMQTAIKAADRDDTIGWVVDLRKNGGGSVYAMVAGIGPILGDGVAGSFVNLSGEVTRWGYRSSPTAGATTNDIVAVMPSVVYTLKHQNPRVAVLSDRQNVSAGEGTLISFIGRPNARVFGVTTCGLSQGVAGFTMADGALLSIPRSVMADRTGHAYGGPVPPDEQITDEATLFARAIAWIRAGQ